MKTITLNQKSFAKTIATYITILGITLFITSCRGTFLAIKGEGAVESVELDVTTFDGINLEDAFDVEVVYGAEQSVIAVGHKNIIDLLKTDVKDGVWNMALKNGNYKNYELTIKIISPEINKYQISGSGNINTVGFENINALETKISGSGNITGSSTFQVNSDVVAEISGSGGITLDIASTKAQTEISGSGTITLTGSAGESNIDIPGSGSYHAFSLKSETVNVEISGSGDVESDVATELDIKISGSGDVFYTGTPSITQEISGSGNIYNSN